MARHKLLLDRIQAKGKEVGDVFAIFDNGKHVSTRIVVTGEGHYVFNIKPDPAYHDGGDADWPDECGLIDIGRRVLDGGLRGDSTRRHSIVEIKPGIFRYIAGCRCFATLREALDHWAPGSETCNASPSTRPAKRKLARNLFKQAAMLGWVTYAVAGLAPKKPSHRRAVPTKARR